MIDQNAALVALMASNLYPHVSVSPGSGETRPKATVDLAAKLLELAEAKYATGDKA